MSSSLHYRASFIAAASVLALVAVFPASVALANEDCGKQYAACIDAGRGLPGDLFDPNSALHKNWAFCQHQGNICEFGPPPASSSSAAKNANVSSPSSSTWNITSVKGDARIKQNGSDKLIPLKPGMNLHIGDVLSTDFDGEIQMKTTNGKVTMHDMTQIRVNETFFEKDPNVARMQLYLRLGRVEMTIPEKSLTHDGFSVVTPTASVWIRGSAVVVRHDDKQKISTVYVTQDKAYVTPITKGSKEITVQEGYKVTVGTDGKVSTSQKFGPEELTTSQGQREKVVQTPGKPSRTSLLKIPHTPAPDSSTLSRLPVVKTQASAEADGYPAKNATDDSPTSMWVASTQTLTSNNNVWISLDFGASKRVQRLQWRASVWEKPYPSNGPSKYRIQRSDDGQNWTDVGGVVDLGIDAKDPRQFTGDETFNVTTRYLRLKVERVNDGATGWSLGLKDFWAEGK